MIKYVTILQGIEAKYEINETKSPSRPSKYSRIYFNGKIEIIWTWTVTSMTLRNFLIQFSDKK